MVCQECPECEYPNIWGCEYRDYDCLDGCTDCIDEDGDPCDCKYESGTLGALINAFNHEVEKGNVNCNPFIRR